MKNVQNKYILTGLIMILFMAGYFLLKDNFTEWDLNLDKTKKNAYGTYLTYELLKDKYQKEGFTDIKNSVAESFRNLDKKKTYNYIFINNTPFFDSSTVDTLCRFAESGNTVFISCENLYGRFLDSVLRKTYHLRLTTGYNELYYSYFEKKDSLPEVIQYATFHFTHPALKDDTGYTYYLKYRADTLLNYFYRFQAVPDTEWTQPIPEINAISFAGYESSYGNGLNLAVLKHGKGKFILLLSALPFTNYFMRTEKGLQYAEKIFAHLPEQATLWDNISHKNNFLYENDQNRGNSSYGESPLYFILQNRSLRRAWYLTILGVIIYAVFHAKRRQNIIPLIEPRQNTSLKYVETIGQLYYNKEEHLEIANEMRLQFMNYIRQRYYIKTNEINDEFLKQLSQKSTVEEEKIRLIFEQFLDILNGKNYNNKQLELFNKQLEYFYKTCK